MRQAPLLVALPLLLAGCLFGHCGLSPESAEWQDPGLFAAMPAPGAAPAGTNATWTAPAKALSPTLKADDAWGPHNLTDVSRQTALDRFGNELSIRLDVQGLTVTHDNRTPTSVVRPALQAFVANVTDLDAAARDAYVDAVVANGTAHADDYYFQDEDGAIVRSHTVTYRGEVPGRLDIDGLYHDLEAVGALQVGLGGANAGPWLFGFSLASRELAGDGGRLTVGPTGIARFEGLGAGERDEDDYRADVRAWLDRHGLPRPEGPMHVGGSIC